LLIEASKQHRKESAAIADDELIGSSIQLQTALALLVRPDPERMLQLSVRIQDKLCVGPWRLRDGQPGVFYELLSDAPVALPAYFHEQGKGIDGLRIEIDLAIARDGDVGVEPELEVDPLPIDTELKVSARKAMTGLGAQLTRTAVLSGVPPLMFKPEKVAPGESALLIVESSAKHDRYTVRRRGEPIGKPIQGNGDALEFELGVIDETTEFELAVELIDPEHTHLPVERCVTLILDAVGDPVG
jgi:hypothetical protein